jgi:hypothetical protein
MIFTPENSNKFPKNRFWKEKSVENCGNTWRLSIQFKHDFLSYLAIQKIDTYTTQQCSHVEFSYFVMGSHLGNSTSHADIKMSTDGKITYQ